MKLISLISLLCSIFMTGGLVATERVMLENKDMTQLLIEYAHNPDGWPVVHYAIEQQRPDVALRALDFFPEQATMKTPGLKLMNSYLGYNDSDDYDFQIGFEEGISALELAVRRGYLELAAALLELKADPCEVRTEYYGNIQGSWDQYHGPKVYEKVKFSRLIGTNYWQRSILYWAVELADLEMVTLLLTNAPTLEGIKAQCDYHGATHFFIERTVTHHAACVASDELLATLIAYQMDAPDLMVSEEVLATFRLYGTHSSGWPPLHAALQENDLEAFHLLLTCKEKMEWQGRALQSLLSMAVAHKDFGYLNLMICYGISPQEAIEEAIKSGNVHHVAHLLPYLTPDEYGIALLELAVEKRYPDIALGLLKQGIRSPRAVELAITSGDIYLTQQFISAGGVVLSQIKGLDSAMRNGWVELVKLLVNAHVQKEREEEDHLLSCAILKGDLELFRLVERAGYRDSGIWEAFVDANAVELLKDYLQDSRHMQQMGPYLSSMIKRAMQTGSREMLSYLMAF